MRVALHEQCLGKTDEWYTPPHVFEALDCRFAMDVASPGREVTPWIPSEVFLTEAGLERSWLGFIWMNPPFGSRNGLVPWLEKFFQHGFGIALVPDRTSAPWWQEFAPRADLALFVAKKIKFIGMDGKPGKSPAQGTTLLAMGDLAAKSLHNAAGRGLGSLFKPALTQGQ